MHETLLETNSWSVVFLLLNMIQSKVSPVKQLLIRKVPPNNASLDELNHSLGDFVDSGPMEEAEDGVFLGKQEGGRKPFGFGSKSKSSLQLLYRVLTHSQLKSLQLCKTITS